jgi:hypothetical protein
MIATTQSCDACGRGSESADNTLCDSCLRLDFTDDESALISAGRGPTCSDRKLCERAGLTPLQASTAALSLSKKLTRPPGTSIRDAARKLWH